MKGIKSWMFFILTAVLMASSCQGGVSDEEREQAKQLIDQARRERNYDRILMLADSLEQTGCMSGARASYWRGYAHDRLKQHEQAESEWRKAIELAMKTEDGEDMDVYARAASHLANLLCVRGDYEGTLRMAEPVVALLDTLKCDTTSDYENLLIYINCSRSALGGSEKEIEEGFERATERHLENIKKNRTDVSYKNAIAGLINIAYNCVVLKKYKYALSYTRDFGELLAEYEQREGVSAEYVDRQLGRYDIYKAMALAGLGRQEEADEVFKAFLETSYSKTPEGEAMAEDYLAQMNTSAETE